MNKQIRPTDTALEKLEKVLPAQSTAAFLAVKAFLDVGQGSGSQVNIVSMGVIVFITLIIPFAARILNDIQSQAQQLIMSITFFIWAINIEFTRVVALSIFDPVSAYVRLLIPTLLILWAVLVFPILMGVFKERH
jgi:hypothetical protein